MNAVRAVWRELTKLFVDDGSLAVGIVAVVVLAALSAAFIPHAPLITGAILLLGCLAVLLKSVVQRPSA